MPGLIISLSLSLALALSLSLALSRSRSRSHSLAFSLSRSLYMKRETNLSLPGSEIHHTACSSLLLLKNSCGKLHCQKGFNSILFSYEVFIPGNMFCFSQSCNGNVYTTRSYQCYEKNVDIFVATFCTNNRFRRISLRAGLKISSSASLGLTARLFARLAWWVCGADPSTLEGARARAHRIGAAPTHRRPFVGVSQIRTWSH